MSGHRDVSRSPGWEWRLPLSPGCPDLGKEETQPGDVLGSSTLGLGHVGDTQRVLVELMGGTMAAWNGC